MNKLYFSDFRTIYWKDGKVYLVDQNKLPHKLKFIVCKTYQDVAKAIRDMTVRGAPAIGAAAAFGLALAAFRSNAKTVEELMKELRKAYNVLRSTRPTAINLFWALERVMKRAMGSQGSVDDVKKAILDEAQAIADEDVRVNKDLGMIGARLIEDGDTILTHCNAGALATVGYGTALGVIRAAVEMGKRIKVIATETRPKLQGARLTVFELMKDGIPVTLITDNMVGYVMSKGMVDKVIVGADRVLKDGHVINKIGTYTIAVLAKAHDIPFYVAAPTSSFDLTSNVQDVVIEERDPDEVRKIGDQYITMPEVPVLNPAFDITPPEYVTAIITERGIIKAPYEENITKLFSLRG
ncbi:MAG: S-methyl-5-thioribose-1-phosphate isomerase [Thermoprotei archaeon]|nr:MAG: S-methyl-5-thioribose-1-phosphate isomerase [Thermoprotei archaeon]